MKILHRDMRAGVLKLRADTVDDLWHLSHVIDVGDIARALTARRQEAQDDRVRADKTEKITMVLPVRVEKVEFAEFANRLRVLGKIVATDDEVSGHHTLTLEPHDWIEIEKPHGWPAYELERVQEAVDSGAEPRVVIVALDDDDATVVVVQAFGVREIARKESGRSGKDFKSEDTRARYFNDILLVLRETAPEGVPVLVVGPGFTREHFCRFLRGLPQPVGNIATEPTGHAGMVGVQESIKRGAVTRINDKVRVAVETEAMDQFMSRLSARLPVAYGPDHVRRALEAGAVERLLVSDENVRTDQGRNLLELARQTRAEKLVVGTGHEAGRVLAQFGGAAAILRYAVE